MTFQEKKTEQGYTYYTEDVFGEVEIESPDKITPELLDDLIVLLLKQSKPAKEIRGEVRHEKGIIKYIFKRAPIWDELDEDEEENICKNTPTLTPEQVKGLTLIRSLMTRGLGWLQRFVEAFQEAWRKSQKKE